MDFGKLLKCLNVFVIAGPNTYCFWLPKSKWSTLQMVVGQILDWQKCIKALMVDNRLRMLSEIMLLMSKGSLKLHNPMLTPGRWCVSTCNSCFQTDKDTHRTLWGHQGKIVNPMWCLHTIWSVYLSSGISKSQVVINGSKLSWGRFWPNLGLLFHFKPYNRNACAVTM